MGKTAVGVECIPRCGQFRPCEVGMKINLTPVDVVGIHFSWCRNILVTSRGLSKG